MPFFAPIMLFALGFAAVPLLLHLFRRRRARRIIWGAWMFLAESMRVRRRRIRIEEIILLVVRTLILACAALAFARPFLPEMRLLGLGGMSRDVVLIMDTSASMGLKRPDGRDSLAASVAEARELVRLAPKDTAFAVIDAGSDGSSGHARVLTASLFTDKAEVYAALDSLKVGTGTMDVPEALLAAAEILSGGNSPAKQIVIYGDGQAYGWRQNEKERWQAVDRAVNRFKIRPNVVWRTPARPGKVRNAAIESLTPSRRIIGTDRPVRFTASVLNAGDEAVNPGALVFSVNGKRQSARSVGQVLPGLTKEVDFSYLFPSNGRFTVTAELTAPDDIQADSSATNAVEVFGTMNVLLVNGHTEAEGFDRPTAFLEAALMGGVTSRTERAVSLEKSETLADCAIVALCDVPQLSPRAATNVAAFVRDGGGLLVVPADRARLDFYEGWSLGGKRLLPDVWTNFDGHACFDEASFTNGVAALRRFTSNTSTVETRAGVGSAAFVVSSFGHGRVGIWAEPMDRSWSALPMRPSFVPLAHELVYDLVATNSAVALADTRHRAREGELAQLSENDFDLLRSRIDLSRARLKDDVLSAVLGKSFGVEIWRPFAIFVLLFMLFELVFSRWVDAERRGEGLAVPKVGREMRSVHFWLRLLAFLSICWMLLHISLARTTKRVIHRRVAVITDMSQSMRRYDLNEVGGTNALARLDTATNCADRLLATLGKRYDVKPFAFGGDTTDFSAALERVLEDIREEELAGCVFLTDGRLAGGSPVTAAARRFARAGARISTVIIGSTSNRCDAAIEDVRAPQTVFLGDKVRVTATLRADGLAKGHIVCKFFDGDKELEKREFDVPTADWRQEVRFQHEPTAKGVRHYRLVIEPGKVDVELENNAWPIDVCVSDDRTNVLLLERRPRWEFRYLRNLFYARDKSVNLQYVLTDPDTLAGVTAELPAASATRPFGEAEAGALPTDREAWRRFDVIILGDLPPETLTPTVAADLKFCIEERGATVVFVAGEKYLPPAFSRSPLAELFPVAVTNQAGQTTARWQIAKFPVSLSPSGASHPLMRLSDSESENRDLWEGFPDWTARLVGIHVRPGSEILAYAGDSTALADPIVVVQHRGRGKTVFVATDETWRLRYRKGDTYHHRFWGNLLRWGAGLKLPVGNEYARIGTDRLHYTPDHPVKIAVRLSNLEAMPIGGASPEVLVKGPTGRTWRLSLAEREDMNGIYEATLAEAPESGRYTVTASCREVERLLGDKWPKPLETAFSVEPIFEPIEFAHLNADETVPREMANLTGGEVVKPDKAVTTLEKAFGSGRGEVEERVETPLWSHPSVFFALALALIAVWILRKRKGLA